ELTAMVNLVLDHRAQPLPRGDGGAGGRRASTRERLGRERSIDVEGLGMRAVQIGDDGIVAIREIATMSGVHARITPCGLGEHVPLGGANVPYQVAERER